MISSGCGLWAVSMYLRAKVARSGLFEMDIFLVQNLLSILGGTTQTLGIR